MKKRVGQLITAGVLFIAAVACNAPGDASQAGTPQGQDNVQGSTSQIPGGGNPASNGATANALSVIGDSCHSSDPNQICIALKYVAFKDSSGNPTVSQADAINNVKGINQVWSQCHIGFQIENYQAIDPTSLGVTYSIADTSDLDTIRTALVDDHTFLVVTTGTWDRTGSLGATGANAWTSLPGGPPYGAILEQPVGTFPNIVAHELGHYMNLDHVSDTSDLMNPIIYSTSTSIYPSQCNTTRSADNYFWTKMLR